jgi:hypothetical protein
VSWWRSSREFSQTPHRHMSQLPTRLLSAGCLATLGCGTAQARCILLQSHAMLLSSRLRRQVTMGEPSQDKKDTTQTGRSWRDPAIIAALIGAAGLVAAAVVAGVFTHANSGGPSQAPASPASPAAHRSSASASASTSDSVHPSTHPTGSTAGNSANLISLPSPGADAVAYSYGDDYLASGSGNGIVRVWSTSNWRLADVTTDPDSKGVQSGGNSSCCCRR